MIPEFYRSTLGKKAVMAVTGLLLFGFVFVHMVGNLKMYQGPEKFNDYADFLRSVGGPVVPESGLLWLARFVLVAAVLLHIHAAWAVSRKSRAARPKGYAKKRYVQADYAVRTMRWGGVIIALYVVYHLLHLTWGVVHPDFQHPDAGGSHAYHNVVAGFQSWPVVLVYLVANIALGFHLYHGMWSLFQSLGWNHPVFNRWRRAFASVFAFVITAGNLSFPIAVMTGVVA